MKIKPQGDRALVLPTPVEDVTTKGIIIPTSSKEKPSMGTVAAIGKGTSADPVVVKKGDLVMYGRGVGFPVEHEGVTYLMMREKDIYAIIAD
jgi:chaperonin GroES|tara:strand:+ start:165 stop:440 length:276 start_codon:yes stop_codon:yes gene_type:complete